MSPFPCYFHVTSINIFSHGNTLIKTASELNANRAENSVTNKGEFLIPFLFFLPLLASPLLPLPPSLHENRQLKCNAEFFNII